MPDTPPTFHTMPPTDSAYTQYGHLSQPPKESPGFSQPQNILHSVINQNQNSKDYQKYQDSSSFDSNEIVKILALKVLNDMK